MNRPLPPSPAAPKLAALAQRILAEDRADTWRIRLQYLWLIARHHRAYNRLVRYLQQPNRPDLALLEQANPRLRFKILYDCHHAGLSGTQRTQRVIAHYELARANRLAALLHQAHTQPEGALLLEVALPQGQGLLPVRLRHYARFWGEGELSLALHDPFGTLLYTLTFSLEAVPSPGETRPTTAAPAEPGLGLLIGSVIGVTSLDNIRHLTKLMQGLRPQNLMLFIAQALAQHLGAVRLRAVGRAGHIFAGTARAERLQFDYDAFWLEQGGQPDAAPARLYTLPLTPTRRAEADIPSHKRAQYRRRHAFLDELSTRLAVALAEWPTER